MQFPLTKFALIRKHFNIFRILYPTKLNSTPLPITHI